MLGGEAELHIKGISIDWDKISRGSYLRDIPSIAGVSSLNIDSQAPNKVVKECEDRLPEDALKVLHDFSKWRTGI